LSAALGINEIAAPHPIADGSNASSDLSSLDEQALPGRGKDDPYDGPLPKLAISSHLYEVPSVFDPEKTVYTPKISGQGGVIRQLSPAFRRIRFRDADTIRTRVE